MLSNMPFNKRSLLLYIEIYVGAGLLVNFLIFSLGWQNNMTPPYPTLVTIPPVVHAVGWTLVLMALAFASWWLQSHSGQRIKVSQRWVFAYFVTTVMWPLVTLSTGVMYASIISFLISLMAGVCALWLTFQASRVYILLLGVPIFWMVFQFLNSMSGWRFEVVNEIIVPFLG